MKKIKFKTEYDPIDAALVVEDSRGFSCKIPCNFLPYDLCNTVLAADAECPYCEDHTIEAGMLMTCEECNRVICPQCAKYEGEQSPPFCEICYIAEE